MTTCVSWLRWDHFQKTKKRNTNTPGVLFKQVPGVLLKNVSSKKWNVSILFQKVRTLGVKLDERQPKYSLKISHPIGFHNNDSHVGGGVVMPTRCQPIIIPQSPRWQPKPTWHNYIIPNIPTRHNYIIPNIPTRHNYMIPNTFIWYNYIITKIYPLDIITSSLYPPDIIPKSSTHTRDLMSNSLNIWVFVNPLVRFYCVH